MAREVAVSKCKSLLKLWERLFGCLKLDDVMTRIPVSLSVGKSKNWINFSRVYLYDRYRVLDNFC